MAVVKTIVQFLKCDTRQEAADFATEQMHNLISITESRWVESNLGADTRRGSYTVWYKERVRVSE